MQLETVLAGRYRIGPLIGTGGSADVHRATDLLLEREVAVKLLRVRESGVGSRDRFAVEARAVGRLTHPGIVGVLDVGSDDEDRPFLVMELLEGPTLAERIADGPLPPEDVRRLGIELAQALAFSHARGVVHRDVKPGNILFGQDGRALLADFGIARLVDETTHHTVTGQVVGSPAYAAPEQVAAEPVGPEADIYSLGLVLFEALTGRRAFRGTTVEVAYARLHAAPELPVSLGPLWVGALGAMTARRPEDRPPATGVAALLTDPPAYDPTSTMPLAVLPLPRSAEPDPAEENAVPPDRAASWRPAALVVAAVSAVALVLVLLLVPAVEDSATPSTGAPTMSITPITPAAMQPSPRPSASAYAPARHVRAAAPHRRSSHHPHHKVHHPTKHGHGKRHRKH